MIVKQTSRGNIVSADSYLSLIRQFPLRPIKDDTEHEKAMQLIGRYLGRDDLDAGVSDYLDTLILLTNKYEDDNHTPSNTLNPQNALRAIMQANELNQKDIGQIIGSESAVSMFLRGDRELSKTHIKALATRFRIDPMIFL